MSHISPSPTFHPVEKMTNEPPTPLSTPPVQAIKVPAKRTPRLNALPYRHKSSIEVDEYGIPKNALPLGYNPNGAIASSSSSQPHLRDSQFGNSNFPPPFNSNSSMLPFYPSSSPKEEFVRRYEIKYVVPPNIFEIFIRETNKDNRPSTLGEVVDLIFGKLAAQHYHNQPLIYFARPNTSLFDPNDVNILRGSDSRLLRDLPIPLTLEVDFACTSCDVGGPRFLTNLPFSPCVNCKQKMNKVVQQNTMPIRVVPNEITLHQTSVLQFSPMRNYQIHSIGFGRNKRTDVPFYQIKLCEPARRFAGMIVRRHIGKVLIDCHNGVCNTVHVQLNLSLPSFSTEETVYPISVISASVSNDRPSSTASNDSNSSSSSSSIYVRPQLPVDTGLFDILAPSNAYRAMLREVLLKTGIKTESHPVLEIIVDVNGSLFAQSKYPDYVVCFVGSHKDTGAWDEISSKQYTNIFSYDKFRTIIDQLFTTLEDFRDPTKLEISHNMSGCYVGFVFREPQARLATGELMPAGLKETPGTNPFKLSQLFIIQSNVSVDYFNRRKLLFYEKKKVMEKINYDCVELLRLSNENRANANPVAQVPQQAVVVPK